MKRQITLNEQQLQDFISYSVRRILKEGQYNLPYYEVELDPENDEELAQSIERQYNKQNDINVEMLDSIWPLYIEVSYDYDAPGDPGYGGSLTLVDWKLEGNQNVPEGIEGFLKSVIDNYVFETGKDYIREKIIDEIENYEPDYELDEEENKGITVHYEAGSSNTDNNPYKGMTWDEYCEAKRREREEEDERFAKEDAKEEKPNKATTIHFNTYDKDEGPDRFAFKDYDPAYQQVHLSREKLSEMITNAINEYGSRMGDIFPDTRLDQEGEFANKIYSLIADLNDEIEEVNQMVLRGEDVDYNTQEYYSLVVKARDILDELAHFRNEDI